MEFGLPYNSPRGVMYLPRQPPPEPEGQQSFPNNLDSEFIKWINTDEGKNRKLLTPSKRGNYRHYLNNPQAKSYLADPKDRQREASEKFHCLKSFELQDSQVYYQAEVEGGKELPTQYCACDYNAAEIIQRIHCNLHHASK